MPNDKINFFSNQNKTPTIDLFNSKSISNDINRIDKQRQINNIAFDSRIKRASDLIEQNRFRSFGEQVQDAGSLIGRSALGIGQIATGAVDFGTNVLSFGNVDLDQLSSSFDGEALSQKFQRARNIALDSESDPLKARRAELSNRSNLRSISNEKFDETNTSITENFLKGFSNFGSSVSDQLEFGTVALDSVLESVPQSLIPGGITSSFSKRLANSAASKASKTANKIASSQLKKIQPSLKETLSSKEQKKLLSTLVDNASTSIGKRFLGSNAGKEALNKIAIRSGLGFVAVSEGISNAGEVQASILDSSESDLNSSSAQYRTLRAEGKTHKEAQRIVANDARDITVAIAGLTGAVSGKLTGASKLEGKGFKVDSPVAKTIASRIKSSPILTSALTEGVEETLQGASGQIAGNIAESLTSNDSQSITEGVVEGAAQGLVIGSLSGGGITAAVNLPKGIGVASKALKEAPEAVSDAVSSFKKNKPVRDAIKSGDLSSVTDISSDSYDPANAVESLLSDKFIPDNEEAIPAFVANVESHISSLTSQLEKDLSEKEIEREAIRTLRDELGSPESDSFDKKAFNELSVRFNKFSDDSKILNDKNDQLVSFKSRLDVISNKTNLDDLSKTSDIITTLNDGIAVNEETSLGSSDSLVNESSTPTINASEANTILGSTSLEGTEGQLDSISLIDDLSNDSKDKVELIRKINSSEVSKELSSIDTKGNKKNVRQHIQNIISNSKDEKSFSDYVGFKENILGKLDNSLTLLKGTKDKKFKESNEYKVALSTFKDQNGSQAIPGKVSLEKIIDRINKFDKPVFDLADKIITNINSDFSLNPDIRNNSASTDNLAKESSQARNETSQARNKSSQASKEPTSELSGSVKKSNTASKLTKKLADKDSDLVSKKPTSTSEENPLAKSDSSKANGLKDTKKNILSKEKLKNKFKNVSFDKIITSSRGNTDLIVNRFLGVFNKNISDENIDKLEKFIRADPDNKTSESRSSKNRRIINNINNIQSFLNDGLLFDDPAVKPSDATSVKEIVNDLGIKPIKEIKPFFEKLVNSNLINKLGSKTAAGVEFKAIDKPLNEFFSFDGSSLFELNDNLFDKNNPDGKNEFVKLASDKLKNKLSDEISASLSNTYDYVLKFIDVYKKSFGTVTLTESQRKQLQQQPVSYFLRQIEGDRFQMPTNVIAAMALSSLEFLNNNAESIIQDDIRSLEGLLGDREYTSNEMGLFLRKGVLRSSLVNQLGQSFSDSMGMKAKDTSPISELANMKTDSGQRIIGVMAQMGLIELNVVPTNLLKLAQSNNIEDRSILNTITYPDNFDYNNVTEFSNIEGRVLSTFVKPSTISPGGFPVLSEEVGSLASIFSGTGSIYKKLFGIENNQSVPLFTKPTKLQKRDKRNLSKIPKRAAEAALKASQKPIKIIGAMNRLLSSIGLDNLNGLISSELTDNSIPIELLPSERSKRDNRLRSVKDYFDFVDLLSKQENGLDTEFFLENVIWTQGRIGIKQNKMNWQNDKFARQIIQYTENAVSIDPNGSNEENLGFMFAITQALDLKEINDDSSVTESIISQFQGLIEQSKDGESLFGRQLELASSLSDPERTSEITSLELSLLTSMISLDAKEPLTKLSGLLAFSKFMQGEVFDTNIFYEIDGLTNGFAITLTQLFNKKIPVPKGRVISIITDQVDKLIEEDKLSEEIEKYNSNKTLRGTDNILLTEDIVNGIYSSSGVPAKSIDAMLLMLSDRINDFLLKERLEKVGIFTQDSDLSNSGEFSSKENSLDSYESLTNNTLNNVIEVKNVLSDEGSFLDISHFVISLFNQSKQEVKTSKNKEGLSALDLTLKRLNNSQEILSSIINGNKSSELIKTANRLSNIPTDIIEQISVMILESHSEKEISFDKNSSFKKPKAIKGSQVKLQNMFNGSESLNGQLTSGTSKNESGVLQFLINSAGRSLAKPSLLVSNYQGSIDSIINTYANKFYNNLILQLASLDSDMKAGILTPQVVKDSLESFNLSVNQIMGTENISIIHSGNLLNAFSIDQKQEIIVGLSLTFGKTLGNTLNEDFSDLFDIRKNLSNVTTMTFELFSRYKQNIIDDYKSTNKIISLSQKDIQNIDELISDVIPFYGTFLSESADEGMFGPKRSLVPQNDDIAFKVVSPIVKRNGSIGTTKGSGSINEDEAPGVRIGPLLTQSIDAAVQILMMERIDPFLNTHDAAGLKAINPKQYSIEYNKAFLEVVSKFSIVDSIMDPLERVLSAVKKDFPFITQQINSELRNENSKVNFGQGILPPLTNPTVDNIVSAARSISSNAKSRRSEFFNNNDLSITQYSIGNTEGFSQTSNELKESGDLDSASKPLKKNSLSDEILEELDQLGSSNLDGLNVNEFRPDSEVELDSNNLLSEFDKLEGKGNKTDSPSHIASLRNTILSSIPRMLGKINLRIKTKGNQTSGIYNPSNGIYLNLAEPDSTSPNFVSGMSAQEAYTHEMVHSLVVKALNENPKLLTEVINLMEKVIKDKSITPLIFMPDGLLEESDPIAYAMNLKEATKRFDYIFNNKDESFREVIDPITSKTSRKKVNNGIHEFIAFSITNEKFIQALGGVGINNINTSINKDSSLFERAVNIFNKILDFISGRLLSKNSKNAEQLARDIFNDLSSIHLKNVTRSDPGLISNVSDKLNGIYGKAFDLAISGLNIMASPIANKINSSKSKIKIGKIDGETVDNFSAGVKKLTSVLGFKHDGLVKSLINELSPRSKTNEFLHTSARVKNRTIDRAIQKITTNVVQFFDSEFNGSLSKSDKIGITKSVLKTDVQSISGFYKTSDIGKLLGDEKFLAEQTKLLVAKISSNYTVDSDFYTILAKNLGFYISTGDHRGAAMHLNAFNIANFNGIDRAPVGNVVEAEQDIDRLATLYAIKYTEASSKASTARLFKESPGSMEKIIEMSKIGNINRLNVLFDNKKAQVIKGYIREKYTNQVKFDYSFLKDDPSLKSRGYYREGESLLKQDLSDGDDERFIYINRYADLNERQSGAFSLVDDQLRGSLVDQDPETLNRMINLKIGIFNKIAEGNDILVDAERENAATPVVDENGDLHNYRYTLNNSTKEGLLSSDLSFDNVLARLETHTISKNRSPLINKTLVREALKTFTAVPRKARLKHFVKIGPNEPGKFGEYWASLPKATQDDIISVWGKSSMFLPIDGVVLAMGQNRISSQSIRRTVRPIVNGSELDAKDFSTRRRTPINFINDIAATLLNNKAVNMFEALSREAVSFIKDIIVIKSGVVLLGNQASNMVTLKLKKVPVKNILRDEAIAVFSSKKYAIDADQITQLLLKLRIDKSLSDRDKKIIESKVSKLNTRLAANPVSELMDAGIHKEIVEDLESIDNNPANEGRISRAFNNNKIVNILLRAKDKNAYTKGISSIGSNLLMTHGSGVYKFLNDATQLSDFAARFALHENNKKNGMSVKDSIADIEDAFINYDLPTHPFLQLGNDIGFIMFSKFFLRIQTVLVDLLVKNPKNVLALMISQSLLGLDPEDIFESIGSPNNLLRKFNNPVGLIDELLDGPLILDTLLN